MFSVVKPLLLYGVTSVHAGSGSDLGVVDLPIQREQHTGYPKIEGSSLKGAIRAHVSSLVEEDAKVEAVFGSELAANNESSVAGAVSFSDARILLFPIRSMRGVFAYITCPHVLQRFNQELETFAPDYPLLPVPEPNTISASALLVGNSEKIVLEEYTYDVQVDQTTQQLAEQLEAIIFTTPTGKGRLANRLVVLPDDDFSDFVQLSTEVNARTKIDPETGTVKEGGLWYEENLPPESVLYSFVFFGESRMDQDNPFVSVEEIVSYLEDDQVFSPVFQLGGNSTIGRGMIRRIWFPKEEI